MKTLELDAVDIDTLIQCLEITKNACLSLDKYLNITDEENSKLISRIDYLLNKVQ